MKTINLLFISIFSMALANAQDYAKVDAKVKSYPKTFATTERLASQIAADFTRQDDRARAAYTWIAMNISYDRSTNAPGRKPIRFSAKNEAERRKKLVAIENDLANKTLLSRKGVCHGYSMLYKVVAEKLGLQSQVVYGTAKSVPSDIGKAPAKGNHAWNVVQADGQWKLVDVTWGSGGISGDLGYDDNYFFTSPQQFFLNHFPDDKKWLLTGKSESEFAALPLQYNLDYEIISPTTGILKSNGSKLLQFKIRGLKAGDDVLYQYTSGAFSHKVTPKITGGVGEFTIVLDKSATGTLTIFANRKSVAAYKIN
ncbi:hypothetical protein OGH69_14250 [Flavobacterium sp. MFBS3-15]|uniref:transglutaminase domain-containing protein n=1 Tax=Flavobacterium sp. MFBS3-15 TaxID=2989816 RepID=UPI0022365616|nr:transglutaminase domain-containing protein [Flavobacterium sp. MFBS3-15]MCW4470135.1 hypothetical protein [Flavobacterium sp. MFBS3-15]